MKYATFLALKKLIEDHSQFAEDRAAFAAALSAAQQTDFLGCSLLRSCMDTKAFAKLRTCDEDALEDILGEVAHELQQNHGIKPYHAAWAASAWCSVLRKPVFSEDEAYTKELEKAELADCLDRASHGDAYAAIEVSVRYSGGERGVNEPNENESNRWMTTAAELMHPIAVEIMADQWSEDESKHRQAFDAITKQIEFAPSNGCFALLGEFYRDGIGCEKDDEKAFQIFQQGADRSIKCLCHLGESYLLGKGCQEDHQKAAECFSLGADCGSPECAEYIYLMMCDGEVDATPQQKFQYLNQAVSGGRLEEISELALMYIRGDGVAKDEQKGFKLLEQGAQEEIPEAIGWLGSCYLAGIGTAVNEEEGIRLLDLATEHDDVRSCVTLAKLYRAGLIKSPVAEQMADAYENLAYELGATSADFDDQDDGQGAQKDRHTPAEFLDAVSDPDSELAYRACQPICTAIADYFDVAQKDSRSPTHREMRYFWYLGMDIMEYYLHDMFDVDRFGSVALEGLVVTMGDYMDDLSVDEIVHEYFDFISKLDIPQSPTVAAAHTNFRYANLFKVDRERVNNGISLIRSVSNAPKTDASLQVCFYKVETAARKLAGQ